MSEDKKRDDTPAELMRFGPPQPDMPKFTKDEIERLANEPFAYPLVPELVAKDTLVQQTSPKDFGSQYRNYLISDHGNWFGFRHKDFDGLGDNRYGHAGTLKEAKELIDEQIESAAN